MGRKIIGYKNRLWQVVHDFQYTGQTEEVTVQPGEYLLLCHGAHGGTSQFTVPCYGGSAMGIWHNTQERSLYVNVGGNGESYVSDKTKRNLGGFNGGGNGGLTYNTDYTTLNTYYLPGAGGGGASDIRTIPDTLESPDWQTIPQEYKQVPYVECGGVGTFVNTDYVVNGDTCIECDCIVYTDGRRKNNTIFSNNRTDSKRFIFSVKYNDSDKPYFFYGNNFTAATDSFIFDERIKIKTNINTASWYKDDELKGSVTSTKTNVPDTGTLRLFNGASNEETKARIYAFKATENDEAKLDLVPCVRKEDGIAGFYDTISGKFYGNSAYPKYQQNQLTAPNDSLNSRFIVAGGGAGNRNGLVVKMYADYAGNGGGAVGGNVTTWTSETGSGRRAISLYATQSSGYSFGHGMNAIDKFISTTNAQQGFCDGGGGGGWFGGYTGSAGNETATGGGGGSGYVLTQDSYKPEGYLLGEEFYLTDTFLCGGDAFEPQVLICKEITTLQTGDHIDFYCTGETTKFTMYSGTYDLMCYGGDGGVRYVQTNSARGGQSGGRINIPEMTTAYVTVGGSGIGTGLISADYATTNRPTVMFNGGGAPSEMGKCAYCGMGGGGSTDIRIGSDSLYARVCVASGGGGEAGYVGGAGGGPGGKSASSGSGVSPGPGTQTSSPQNTSYPTINGGFGFGGNGTSRSSSAGGAGGSGWYGGSGTQTTSSSDYCRGGNGGSGFVLSNDSEAPSGYLLGKEYWMTNIVNDTIKGDWAYGHTKAEIDVISANTSRFLCEDSEGYKYYDVMNGSWVFLRNPVDGVLSIEDFDQHPCFGMTSVTGLISPYTIYVQMSEDTFDQFIVRATPKHLTIHGTFKEKLNISGLFEDFEYDKTLMDIKTNVSKHGIAEGSKVDVDMNIMCKEDISEHDAKLFCLQIFSTGNTSGKIEPYNPPQKEPIHGNKSLLPVGTGMRIPMKYRQYYTTMPDGSAVTEVTAGYTKEKDRMIYMLSRLNRSQHILYQFNLMTCKIDKVWEYPNDYTNNQLGDFLYDPDQNKLYVTKLSNYTAEYISVIDITTNEFKMLWVSSSYGTYSIGCYGQMEWFGHNKLIVYAFPGIAIIDTETTLVNMIPYVGKTQPYACGNFSVGKKLCVMQDQIAETSRKDVVTVCDIEKKEWSMVTLQTGDVAVSCYHDGKFYITQKNYLYIYDEESMVIEETIATPWNTMNPYSIQYGDRVLYITIENSPMLYVYDLRKKNFTSVGMQSAMPTRYGVSKRYRPCTFRGFHFLTDLQFLAVNAANRNKYSLGYKYNQYLFPMDKAHVDDYTYDETYVTFNDSHARIHVGDTKYPLEVYNEADLIKRATIDDSVYLKITKIKLDKSI